MSGLLPELHPTSVLYGIAFGLFLAILVTVLVTVVLGGRADEAMGYKDGPDHTPDDLRRRARGATVIPFPESREQHTPPTGRGE